MGVFNLSGRTAFVTGASRGIGLGVARGMAESGAGLILVGRDPSELDRIRKELPQPEERIHVAVFDLQRTSEISTWFEELCRTIGSPDILVNSAGINRRGTATDLSLGDWNDVIALNLTAVFELCRAFARVRIGEGRGGRIVNIASLMTAAARPGVSPYAASKGAIGQLTKAFAAEWAKFGILVNAVAPGYIDTDLNKGLIADPEFDKWVKDRCPLGRWGTPRDVAWPVVFLASPAADFITGQVIYVDGGWLATF
jgi:gluconate 5-dehydrogenase